MGLSAVPWRQPLLKRACWKRSCVPIDRVPLAAVGSSRHAAQRTMATVGDEVRLTEEEQELFATLLAAASHAGTGTIVRCAGGWVRDKLLGKDSKDIDIALDNMLGREFGDKVNDYLRAQGRDVCSQAVIQSNPQQSKHLETARLKLNGLWLDLVNLRAETYADSSRIPTMEFGTAEQDALRRDFTINAMFYNLNTACVEDLTGRGLEDLRGGIIRTPLPASETFMDDPLRVLRAVRFAARFDFTLDTQILEVGSSEPVRQALGSKVSRERVGTELEGMFAGVSPTASILLLHRMGLFPQVFTPPAGVAGQLPGNWSSPCTILAAAAEQLLAASQLELSVEARRLLLISALLLPLRQLAVHAGKAHKPLPAASHIVRESIKWRVKEAEGVEALGAAAPQLLQVAEQLRASPTGDDCSAAAVRVRYGRLIRQLKDNWRLGVLLAPLVQLPQAVPLGVEEASGAAGAAEAAAAAGAAAAGSGAGDGNGQVGPAPLSEQQLQAALGVVQELLAAAAAFKLEEAWHWKSLLSGKEVMQELGIKKAGPQLGQLLDKLMDWQLSHPEGTAEEAKAQVKQLWAGMQQAG